VQSNLFVHDESTAGEHRRFGTDLPDRHRAYLGSSRGVVSRNFSWNDASIYEKVKEVHKLFEEVRGHRPQPLARFPTLSICLPCKSSGLSAVELDAKGNLVSWTSLTKQQKTQDWQGRINKILGHGHRSEPVVFKRRMR
jgi:hypothetical protein